MLTLLKLSIRLTAVVAICHLPNLGRAAEEVPLLQSDVFTRDFLAASVGQRYWVHAVKKNRDLSSRGFDPLAAALRLRSIVYDSGEKVRKWQSSLVIATSGDAIVDSEADIVIKQLTHNTDLGVMRSRDASDANVEIHLFGEDWKSIAPPYRLGYPYVDLLTAGWQYKYQWPQRIYIFRKIGLYRRPWEIWRLFNEDFVLYRDAVVFTPDSQIGVEGFIRVDKQDRITKAECYIYAGHDPDTRRALAGECIFRALGFPSDLGRKTDSVLFVTEDETRRTSGLSPSDILFAKVLYAPQIEAGTTRSAAEPIVKEFLTSLLSDQTPLIKNGIEANE